MRHLPILCITLSLVAGSAAGSDLCSDIRSVGARGGDITMTLPDTGAATTCTRSLMLSGGSQVHCGWPFPYRAPTAKRAFDNLVAAVSDCLGAAAHVTADLDVNHPDFYDLQTFQSEDHEVGVSLKDKAALSETYVFLRIAPPQ